MRLGIVTPQTGAGVAVSPLRRFWNQLRIVALDRREARERSRQAALGLSVQERQAQLIEFYRQYEELVEVLCDAAQYGPTPALDKNYARLRAWMQEHYAPIRRYVIAYLQFTAEDAATSLKFGEAGDAFEALVAAPDLEAFLTHDDGMMISRLTRTREALNLYGEHLRQLARA